MRKTKTSQSVKEPASRKPSGLAHLIGALHQNAAAVVNSKSQLNGPDQVGPEEYRNGYSYEECMFFGLDTSKP